MLKRTACILLLFVITGCGTGLNTTWSNFTAYFNTYYNAKDYYQQGFQTVQEQQPKINPERPIRIFEAPTRAGISNFEKAIEKGAKILREYEDSDLLDDALLLIGKSYYFTAKNFSAIQKFEELERVAEEPNLKQEALLWKGRTMYEMQQYEEMITLLNQSLQSQNIAWDRVLRARVLAVLAEAYVAREDWIEAEEVLVESLDNLDDDIYAARGWFLLGQVNERLENIPQARFAYNQVPTYNPPYELVYTANRKRAEMSRKNGDLESAYNIFLSMSTDDKNIDVLPELRYEIGKTLQEMERYKEAEKSYRNVLYDDRRRPEQGVQALTHYALGEIYRDYYKNLSIAAAYFDTSAKRASNRDKLPEDFNAKQLADAYGSYKRLSDEAHKKDSLLWLSNLEPKVLDSVLADLKQRKLEEAKRQAELREKQQNTMVTGSGSRNNNSQGQNGGQSSNITTETSTKNGFLNYQSPVLVAQAREEFFARWGRRPLVDNWRRLQAVRSMVQSGDLSEEQEEKLKPKPKDEITVTLDLAAIPTDSASKKSMREDLAKHYYELGNVFFITLNEPDSASRYYSKVIDDFSSFEVAKQAKYSLSELYFVSGDSLKARGIASDLVQKHPENRFASRLNEKYRLGQTVSNTDSTQIKLEKYRQTLALQDSLAPERFAEQLRSYQATFPESDYAAAAMFGAAKGYVRAGKSEPGFTDRVDNWNRVSREYQVELDSLTVLKDSAQVVLADSTITDEQKAYWKSISDSTLKKPYKRADFPYMGAVWDSARVVLKSLVKEYPKFKKIKQANILFETLRYPEAMRAEIAEEERKAEEAERKREQERRREEEQANSPDSTATTAPPDTTNVKVQPPRGPNPNPSSGEQNSSDNETGSESDSTAVYREFFR